MRGVAILLVITALIATCGGPAPSGSPTLPPTTPMPIASSPAEGPSATPGVTPLPTSSPPATGWTKLDVPAVAAVARLEATRTGAGAVAPETTFRLTSLSSTPARTLAAHISVTPRLAFTVARVTTSVAILRPNAPLRQGQVYRFELRRADGSTEAAWAVQAAWPLKVASTIPGDANSDVPRDTGIEIAFDQAGVRLSDFTSHFSISPAVEGRFEQHGLTFVFVPLKPLAASLLYTVTVRHGLPLAGTGMTLEQDAVVRFETTGEAVSWVHVTTGRALFDASPTERAVVSVNLDRPEGVTEKVTRLAVTVHRLGGITAAMTAYRQITSAPDWTERSSTTPVRTASLPLVLSATLPLKAFNGEDEWIRWFQLPRTLSAGWYVVTVSHAGIDRQTVLQVTNLSAFAMVTRTSSLVWVNDLRTNAAVAGADVALYGRSFGATDAKGLRYGTTPAALISSAPDEGVGFAVVRSHGRAVFLPLDAAGSCYVCSQGDQRWWRLLSPDRDRYRVTDTINVWGVLRDRDTGAVPASVVVRLVTTDDAPSTLPAVASATVKPDRSGAFVAHLAFKDLPPADYRVEVMVGGKVAVESWIAIGPISKPAWKMDLTTPKRAVIVGTEIPVTAAASFFEGTPVAGTAIRLSPESEEQDASPVVVTTDAGGITTGRVKLTFDYGDTTQWTTVNVYGTANEPEEADITASLPMAVFRSSALLESLPTLRGTTLTLKGGVYDVAFSRFDNLADASFWDVDPKGAPRPGATVRLRVVENIPVVTQTGTRYDFIAKRAVPVYRVTENHRLLGTWTVTTGAKGAFGKSLTVKGGGRSYEVFATYTDEAGRTIGTDDVAWQNVVTAASHEPRLTDTVTGEGFGAYGIGDTVSVRFGGGITSPEVRRYLFAVSARGLRSASVQDGSKFTFAFTKPLLPAAGITAVRFTGTGYEVLLNAFAADYRTQDRQLQVQVTPDRDRYAPGDRATVAIRTLNAAGHAVSASVFVRTVDEKLFAIGAASAADPLQPLYESPGSGLISGAWSHADPTPPYGDGKGDTTGGGGGDGRADFRDWLVARLVTTGADGRAAISFDLSDDLTSWRVVATGITPRLDAGIGQASLPVSLPFFADAIVAPEYLSVDQPVIRVRAYGGALSAGTPVTFTVSSDTLPMAAVTVRGVAFEPSEVTLPKLSLGAHRIRVAATTGSGSAQRTDVLTRTFSVVETRTIMRHTESVALVQGTTVDGAAGLTSVTLVDAGRGRVVPILREIAAEQPYRADSALAAAIARDLLATGFGIPDDPALPDVDLLSFQSGDGFALLPYASPDVNLAAMASLSGDARVNRDQLRNYFSNFDPTPPTDVALALLLGRAGLGDASIGEVTSWAARTDLTASQRITVALAAVALGDEGLARSIERDLLATYGERLGPWVRLHTGAAEATAVATARLAIVAAFLGDPLAADMDAEIVAHPPADTLTVLERAIAAKYWAARMPKTTVSAAVTMDGVRRVVTITADEPAMFAVTPAQRAGLRIDPVTGAVLVISQWDGALRPSDLSPAPGQAITRRVTPVGAIGATDTVAVTFTVTLGTQADNGCWRVTDFAPSGLVPISTEGHWATDDSERDSAWVITPWRVVGQRVDFCVSRDPKHPIQTLRYLARVITTGDYRWEPAVLQSTLVPEQGIVLPAFDVTIKGTGS